MWPFRKKLKFYVNDKPCDRVKHAFEWFGGCIAVMQSGDAYIIKHNWKTEDYQVIRIESIDGRVS